MYKKYNAEPVLKEVEKLIAEYEQKKAEIDSRHYSYWSVKPRVKGYPMDDVYERLSIFDWWVETLGIAHLRQMRSFLREAVKLGFTGYVCFKVGAEGCTNGMWAHTDESLDGSSPNTGECIYRSFAPSYTYWSFTKNGEWFPSGKDGEENAYDSLDTMRKFEDAFVRARVEV